MAVTFPLTVFLVLYHLRKKVELSEMEQAASNISFKLKDIQPNRNECSRDAPFALSVATDSGRTPAFAISLINRWGSGKEYLSLDDDSGIATFGELSNTSLFLPHFEERGRQERYGIESCKGFFLINNSTGQTRFLHLRVIDGESPHFVVSAKADKPLRGSHIVLGLRRICADSF